MANNNKTNVEKLLSCSLDELVQMKKKENKLSRQRGSRRFNDRGRGGRGGRNNNGLRRNQQFNRKSFRRDRGRKPKRMFGRRDRMNGNINANAIGNNATENRNIDNSFRRGENIRRIGGNVGRNAHQNRRKITKGNFNGRPNLSNRPIGKTMWQNTSLARVLKAKTFGARKEMNGGGRKQKPILRSKTLSGTVKLAKEQTTTQKRSTGSSFFSPKQMSKIKIVASLDKLPAPLPGQTNMAVAMPHAYRNQGTAGRIENFVVPKKGTLNERFG